MDSAVPLRVYLT